MAKYKKRNTVMLRLGDIRSIQRLNRIEAKVPVTIRAT
jgi:hypothetical protein